MLHKSFKVTRESKSWRVPCPSLTQVYLQEITWSLQCPLKQCQLLRYSTRKSIMMMYTNTGKPFNEPTNSSKPILLKVHRILTRQSSIAVSTRVKACDSSRRNRKTFAKESIVGRIRMAFAWRPAITGLGTLCSTSTRATYLVI